MPVFRFRDSWEPLRDFERQVDRLLEAIPFPFPAIRLERQFPPVNVYDLDDEYLVTAELPGISPADLDLSVAQGVLTLKGTRPGPVAVGEEQFRRRERMWGEWGRSLTLPERVIEEKITVDLSDGILKVHLPKAPQTKPRKIAVASGNGQ
ncbi:MAG: Hsp20/alpha crystallin family protein [Planctomycetaceae bacterium]